MLILAGIGFLSYWNTQGHIKHSNQVDRTYQVIATLDNLLIQAFEVESATRSYVISGEESILTPYHESLNKLDRTVRTLESQIDSSEGQALFVALKVILSETLRFQERLIETRRTEGQEAALRLSMTGTGIRLMTRIRGPGEQPGRRRGPTPGTTRSKRQGRRRRHGPHHPGWFPS